MKIFYYYDKRGEKVNRPPGYCKLRGKHKIKQKKPPHASQRRAVLDITQIQLIYTNRKRPALLSAGRPVFRLWKFCIHGNISPLAMQESINQNFNLKFNQLFMNNYTNEMP